MSIENENYFVKQSDSFTCESCENDTEGEYLHIFENLNLCPDCAFERASDLLLWSKAYDSDFLTDEEFNKNVLLYLDKVNFVSTESCTHPVGDFINFKNNLSTFCPQCGFICPF